MKENIAEILVSNYISIALISLREDFLEFSTKKQLLQTPGFVLTREVRLYSIFPATLLSASCAASATTRPTQTLGAQRKKTHSTAAEQQVLQKSNTW